ncbi:MAG: DUF4910 domain-containing protein [Candidatus Omnitrophica bacterium]|nr:DUF4910 domain-containing protein [Candidatus Omnitrophota bacterium]
MTAPRTECQKRMAGLIEELWRLERDLVSDGFDQALARVARELPMRVHQAASGAEAWTWLVPPKWSCQEAYVERMNGERILDRRQHPLHCASYGAPFEGIVSRDVLKAHLTTSKLQPEAIPYAWKHYRDDWGLSCTRSFFDSLTDDAYRVVIRTRHEPGFLKVGEAVVPGSGEEEFVLCAHLDHPAMVNDDLSGVVVGLEVMRSLLKRPRGRFTYRLLLTPETIGSVVWLSQNESLIPRIRGGLFLEMLGTDCPHSLAKSFQGQTRADQCLLAVLQERDPQAWVGPFRKVICNDERQFNAPGVRVPMLSLSRVFHPDTGKWPYPEYHSSLDTPDIISWEKLEESVEMVLAMIDRLERDRYPVNLFKGEVFCTRYNLFVDFYEDPEAHRALFDTLFRIDGSSSIQEIAQACGLPFKQVARILDKLEEKGLVRFSDTPVSPPTGISENEIALKRG